MKVCIAGSRSINDYETVCRAMLEYEPSEIVHGGARGVDSLAGRYAKDRHIACTVFPADWDKHGRRAGYLRNIEMAEYADMLVAVWDGESRGTKHSISEFTKRGKPVKVVEAGR